MGALIIALLMGAAACSEATDGAPDEIGDDAHLPYATEIVKFSPGEGAGWGQEHLPQVVLGPPDGAYQTAAASGADQVLSLGAGGEIILAFDGLIVDGPGPDFVVFENPFWVQDDPENVWYELGEVSVSQDGEEWHVFSCDEDAGAADGPHPGQWPGCAGWSPTNVYDPQAVVPIDPAKTGGDAFDLADLGLDFVRYVRIRDLLESANSGAQNAGFDLDAVGVVHLEPETAPEESN